jgi:hypothetical protein
VNLATSTAEFAPGFDGALGIPRRENRKERAPARAIRSSGSFGGWASSLERHGIPRCSMSVDGGQPRVARKEGYLLMALSLFI